MSGARWMPLAPGLVRASATILLERCTPSEVHLMDVSLAGRVALVTGGGSGIGEAACHALAEAGAAVAVVDVRPEPARLVAERITSAGGRAIALTADVSDEEGV